MPSLMLYLLQIRFDPTISAGTILNTIAMVAALAGIYVKLSERVTIVETKLDMIWKWWCAQHGVDPERDSPPSKHR